VNTSVPEAPLLEVENLSTTFMTPRGPLTAVDGVSLSLNKGQTYGLVGESGSGKTVFSRSMLQLNVSASVQTTGSVKFMGEELLTKTRKEMQQIWGKEISMVFQDPMTSLNPVMKVGTQVTEHIRHHLGLNKKEARELGVELLRSVQIPEPEARMNAYPHECSGGMRQRISIAIALACGSKLLIADEPTTALDVTVQHQILNLLDFQRRDRDMAMVLVTHDLGVIAGRADNVAVMYAGRIVELADTKTLFAAPKMPYTEALLQSIPRMDQPAHSRLASIPGRPPDLVNPPKGCAFAPRCAYAQEQCENERPPITTHADGTKSACWIPLGTPASREALEKNLSAGRPQALALKGIASVSSEVK
jgi:peptide/nickel transport system ATP-binding protein